MSNSGHHPAPMSPVEQRVAALEALLTERGLVPEGFIEQITRRYESEIGPMNGAKVVARAWLDPQYKQRLLADGTAAIAELGFGGPEGDHMVVVENTAAVHNVIVCTLCSCYPWPVLGLPPAWYKDPPYRARMVREPRVLLAEMSCPLPEEVEIRVWDSSAEVRYLALPQRPPATQGMTEAELAALVTRDSMIGVPGCDDPAEPVRAGPAPPQWRAGLRHTLAKHRVRAGGRGHRACLRRRPGTVPATAHQGHRRRTWPPYWESWTAALQALVPTLPEHSTP